MPLGTLSIENFPLASVVAVNTVSTVTTAPATGLLLPSTTVPCTDVKPDAGGNASLLHAATTNNANTASALRNRFIGERVRRAEGGGPMSTTARPETTLGPAYCENALEAIGHTPLVKLNKVTDGAKCLLLAKV